ncbi:MAG: TolC family protein [Victivallales bacterium]|nr:TolC family protein [Victivallales bacterium]
MKLYGFGCRRFKKAYIFINRAIICGALGLFAGCYSYPPAQVATEADTFSQKKTDRYSKLLDNITILRLADAQKIAVKNNPDYASVYHAVNAAKMRYYQALGAYSPVVTANFQAGASKSNYSRVKNSLVSSGTETYSNVGLNATWLLFNGLARTMEVMAQQHTFKATKANKENVRRILMQSVGLAYYDILLAIERQRIAKSNMEFQLTQLRDTQMKFEAGAVPLSEVLNFKVEVNVATVDQIEAEYEYEVAVYALARLMGFPDGNLPERVKFPTISSATDDRLTSVDVYLDAALNNRPDLRRYRELLQTAKYTMYKSYGPFFPTVNAYGSLSYSTSRSHDFSPSEHSGYDLGNFDGGVQAEWLIFNGFERFNRVRETEALVAQAKFDVANTWLLVIEEVRSAYINYVLRTKQAQIYKKTLGLVTKQRDLVEEEYHAGNTELARLFQAQNVLIDAEVNLVRALVAMRKAKVSLNAATNTNTIGVDMTVESD